MNDSPPIRFVLRDLPGVAELEALCIAAARPWAKEEDLVPAKAEAVARALFGITDDDTEAEYACEWIEYPTDRREWYELPNGTKLTEDEFYAWEQHFELAAAYMDDPTAIFVWRALGWDVCDAEGKELCCLAELGRPMIAATKKLIPGAFLPGDGGAENARAIVDADAWGAELAAQARARMTRPRGR